MPLYYFALDDEAPSSESVEELPSSTDASEVATLIAGELSRNRYGREIAVSVFDENGKIIDKIWTRSKYDSDGLEQSHPASNSAPQPGARCH